MRRFPTTSLACCLLAALLSACSVASLFGGTAAGGSHPRSEGAAGHASAALREGIALYNDGEFNAAIHRLRSADVAGAPAATRVKALKYTAFSYCVTSRPAQCREAFDKALRLDPSFDLTPGEHGHPLWGPVFARARAER